MAPPFSKMRQLLDKVEVLEVIDTNLRERIVQMEEEPPSHIVMPAIHKKKEEIGELFHRKLATEAGRRHGRVTGIIGSRVSC